MAAALPDDYDKSASASAHPAGVSSDCRAGPGEKLFDIRGITKEKVRAEYSGAALEMRMRKHAS